jgi:hypothetical protein
MHNHIYVMNHDVMNEDTLMSLCMLIPGENLRRAVARCLWFDVVDELPQGMRVDRLKALADPERVDREIDWTEEEEAQALAVVGYRQDQIEVRMKVLGQYRARERRGSSPPEYTRLMENGGETIKRNQWSVA